MDLSSSLQLSLELGIGSNHRSNRRFRVRSSTIFWYSTSNYRFLPLFSESSHFKLQNSKASGKICVLRTYLSSFPLNQQQYSWSRDVSKKIRRRVCTIPSRNHLYKCRCFLNTGPFPDANCLKNAALTLTGPFKCLQGLQNPLVIKLSSAVGIFIFAIWGLGPLIRQIRNILLRKSDSTWKRSSTYHVTTSYIQPLLLWVAAISICRALDPIIVPTEAGQVVKQRVLNFVRSISTVLAFARCFSSVIEQAQKFFMETSDPTDSVNMGFQFSGRAVSTAVWVAAVSLFMELLGFSTQKWITAGGFGTVLLTLAGREIFTNFLSSVMIHATRPFVLNEWIQTKIQGYDVSGTVEHVGWWSPTIIRGDDREAVHIPNNKFTVNIVRNLSQKTHWRIKTHLAISHLDVGKIHIIVADMRKVLAKNPHVEQQKLHRRVFFDKVNPENQALLILVSCFVKTSRFEEYLSVKEAILLDLLRVISHHRARLATPIRTIQRIYRDPNLDSVPFSDSMFTWGTTSDRPYMLIEPPYKINGEDKTKTQARSAHINVDDAKATPRSTNDPKPDAKEETTLKTNAKSGETEETQALDAKPGEELGQRAKVTDPKLSHNAKKSKTDTQNTYNNKPDEGSASTSESKPDVRTRSSLEENILLGVALEGSKRTLPIDEDISDAEDTKKMSPLHSSNGPRLSDKDKSGNLQDQN